MSPPSWRRVALGQLSDDGAVTIQTGPFGSQLHARDYQAVGIPVVPTEAIGGGRIKTDALPRISGETVTRLARHRLEAGDILFARRGIQATGSTGFVDESQAGWICGTGAILVRVTDSSIDPRFLSFAFRSPSSVAWLKSHAVGAVMPNLNENVLRQLAVGLPPIQEQRSIARVLQSLDNKIELNRKMNETIEGMSRAIFKSWFVDFDPVCAKMEGHQPFGMDAETAELFPDSFQESSIGQIPKGWGVSSLDGIASFLNGLALQRFPGSQKDGIPVIRIAELRRGDTRGSDYASREIPADHVVNDGDILFSWSGTLEVRIWCGGQGALNQHLFKVTSAQFPGWFYYMGIREHLADFRATAAGKATTMGHIQRHHLSAAKVVVPRREVLRAGDRVIGSLLRLYVHHSVQNRTLAALRDTLLPKLISGEIRLKDAEKHVEAAL